MHAHDVVDVSPRSDDLVVVVPPGVENGVSLKSTVIRV